MKKYALPITFFLFLFSFSLAVHAAESETEIEGTDAFSGSYGVFAKENTKSQYIITLVYGSGSLKHWAWSLVFWDLKHPYDKIPILSPAFSVTCSKEDYEKLEVGDYVRCDGIYVLPPNNFRAGEGRLKRIRKNCGPMIYDPDGLILWLYRDLPRRVDLFWN